MEVIVMESEAFKKLEYLIERNAELMERLVNRDPDRILSLDQAAEYIGVTKQWVSTWKKAISYFKESKLIRIRKSDIDKYLEKHTIKGK